MRLFPPVNHIARSSGKTVQTVRAAGKTYELPPNTMIYILQTALHVDPGVWGDDALDFRPSRWLTTNTATKEQAFVTMPKGSYLPWAAGPMGCPGTKMSEVEFVSVFMTIFRDYRVEPAVDGSKTLEEARRYFLELMDDSQSRLTLQMNKPKDVKMRWTARD